MKLNWTASVRLISLASLLPLALGSAVYCQDDSVVATVKGAAITMSELEASVEGELLKLERQRHQLLENAIGPLVDQKLLEIEAQERELTSRELLALEIDAQIELVTDADVDQWFEQNKTRLGSVTKEQVASQIQQFLTQQRTVDRRAEYLKELRKKHEARVLFEPMRSEIDLERATFKGNPEAPVTLVEFSDFQCPACKSFNPQLQGLLELYPEQVRVAFFQYPLRSIHPQAQKAAEAALCARDQGKFWQLHDVLFADQQKLGVDALKASARELGLDGESFDACLDSDQHADNVQADIELGDQVGVSGTPSVYVNGREVAPGQVPSLDMLRTIVDDELARSSADD